MNFQRALTIMLFVALTALFLGSLIPFAAFGQDVATSTDAALTYQGNLKQSGQPVNASSLPHPCVNGVSSIGFRLSIKSNFSSSAAASTCHS